MTQVIETIDDLKSWIASLALIIEDNGDLGSAFYQTIIQTQDVALYLIELIQSLQESDCDGEQSSYYSACIFAIDVCVSQLNSGAESGHKWAEKTLNQLMQRLSAALNAKKHSLGFWLPILNSFYDVRVELSSELKQSYLALATTEESFAHNGEVLHLNSIRDLISELSYLSVFDIAEHFFAQSYAMPPDFFSDLLLDLYNMDEGPEVALLMLLHPDPEVRAEVIETLDVIMPKITLSSIALTRLQAIKSWYPINYHAQIDHWIKMQRKKGVVYATINPSTLISLHATEVDGSGAQGVFFTLRRDRKQRLCGLLFKQDVGLKEAWMTTSLSAADAKRYHEEAFDDRVMLRPVELNFLQTMTNHFLSLTIAHGSMPDLHLLEIQEALGITFAPRSIAIPELFSTLSIAIVPFTAARVDQALKRSMIWAKQKRFTDSWYQENMHIDKLVNRCCTFVNGDRRCRVADAMNMVFAEEMELNRTHWHFHFLWMSFWLKSGARKNEKTWEDALLLAYVIDQDMPMSQIPLMRSICEQSVINSLNTMQERRTHLNQE